MTYYTLGLGTTDPGRFHVWDDDGADWVEPPEAHIPDHADPVGPPLCGSEDYHSGTALDPITERADTLRDFIRRTHDEVCPGCYLALERRHALPESYRTETLDERITEYQADTTERVVPPGSTEADVVDAARVLLEEARSAGADLSDLTLRVDRETHEALREEAASWGPATRKMEVLSDPVEFIYGVPVTEDPSVDGMDLAEPMTYESFTVDIEVEDLAIEDLDLSIDTEAMDRAVRETAERMSERMKAAGLGGGLDPSAGAPPTHPSTRCSTTTSLGDLPEDAEDLLDLDPDELAERVRAETEYEGRHPAKYVPEGLDPAPVAGQYPGVSGVTKDADTWCLDCAVSKGWVDFQPEPTQPDVDLILRDTEWDHIPRCGECERPLDVPSLESGWDAAGTFTGTCVQRSPLVLDDGYEAVRVRDLGWLGGEDPRLGSEYEAPITAVTPAEGEDS